MLLTPALVALGLLTGMGGKVRYSLRSPPIPWFVIGFLALGVVGSTGLVHAEVRALLSSANVFLMVVAMAAMGLNLDLATVRRAGMRVVYAGLLGFGGLAASVFVLIRVPGIL